MFGTLAVMRQLHELLYYLTEALTLRQAHSIHSELRRVRTGVEASASMPADQVLRLDVAERRSEANALLRRTSELTRASEPGKKRNHAGADLIGKPLLGADLRGANLRGAYLIGADLRKTDLSVADVTGADTRDTDFSGADLSRTLFLIQSQLDAARGDDTTRLSKRHRRPAHW